MSTFADFSDHPVDFRDALDAGLYRAYGQRAVDGDTVDVIVDPGFRGRQQVRLRLAGVNTPEIYGVAHDSEEYRRGEQARQLVADYIEGYAILVRTGRDTGKYGRWLATVYVDPAGDRHSLADIVIEEGLGEPT